MARVMLLRLCLIMAAIGTLCSGCTLLTDFEVSDLRAEPETAYSGDRITATVDVKNNGYVKSKHKVVLEREGAYWMTDDVTVDTDSSEEVSFSWVEDPIGQTEKKTIHISVGDLSESFVLLGRKRMEASVSISTDGIVIANTNDYTWLKVEMQLDPEVGGGNYVYSWDGPIAPFDGDPDNLFIVGWWRFVKGDTAFKYSTISPQLLTISAETEWGDEIMWSGTNLEDRLFEEVLST